MKFTLGQSNSTIEIINTDTIVCIKKTSKEDRFKLQYEKHRKASTGYCEPINVPKILSNFNDNSYKMEYIVGKTLGQALENASSHMLNEITNQIGLYFKKIMLSSTKTTKELFISPIITKLKSIDMKLESIPNIDNLMIKSVISRQLKNINLLEPIIGFNHGDFSFENLIVKDTGHLYLIDFLDSPIDTPFIDFGRLYLDSSMGWWNAEDSMFSRCQNQINFETSILRIFNELEISMESLLFFKIFAALRIIPYTKNPTRLGHLKFELCKFLDYR